MTLKFLGSGINEYGGTCLDLKSETEVVYFSSKEKTIYLVNQKKRRPLFKEEGFECADFHYSQALEGVIFVYQRKNEDHQGIGLLKESGEFVSLVSGDDFYAYPRVSPCGSQLLWCEWNLPYVPWQQTRLKKARLNNKYKCCDVVTVSDGSSALDPQWNGDDFFYVSDQTGYWNLYLNHETQPFIEVQGEMLEALWQLGQRSYQVTEDKIYCRIFKDHEWKVYVFDRKNREVCFVSSGYAQLEDICVGAREVNFIAGTSRESVCVRQLSLELTDETKPLNSSEDQGDEEIYSEPVKMMVPVPATSYKIPCYFYESLHLGEDKSHLVILKIHGGPTGYSTCGYSEEIQEWVKHGFSVLDVNYRGSSHWGREYRDALWGSWGVSDAEDILLSMNMLIQKYSDKEICFVLRGKSSSGLTLMNVMRLSDHFQEKISGVILYYPVVDVGVLHQSTHKYEVGYTPAMIGENEVLVSPVNFVESYQSRFLILQGEADAVVPQAQTDGYVTKMREYGNQVEYVLFSEEKHGFRKSESRELARAKELEFLLSLK